MKVYVPGPESSYKEEVPRGKVIKREWVSDRIYPGTHRNYWIYVPAQYDRTKPANVMIFQDGGSYAAPEGDYRTPAVFDNLIDKGSMPVTIGIFIDPGYFPGKAVPEDLPTRQRQIEYDTLSDTYVRFILEEMIPEIRKEYDLTADRAGWAACGASSGGISSWTAAWERPDVFSKVLSFVGSFEDIRGGHNYPSMIRKTPKKDIRIFLTTGKYDLDWEYGNWELANRQMAAALKFKGYDYKFICGMGGHDHKHAGAILPAALRWLWRK